MRIQYSKTIEVRYETDVCVVGGGPAGVAAAVSAARQGANVFVVESQGFFGGGGTAALVPAFMPFDNGIDFLSGGIGKEIYDKCIVDPEVMVGRCVGIQVEHLKKIYDEMIIKEKIDFLFHASMIDVIVQGEYIDMIVVAAKSGMYAIKAKVFIDATGDGDLCAWGGAPFEKGDENGQTMPSTLCSLWVNIDWENMHKSHNLDLERAFLDGVFTQEDRHVSGIFKTGKTTGGGNIGHAFGVDGTNEVDLTRGMVSGRRILAEFTKYFNEYVGEGYTKAFPVITGSYLGVRESRRIIGDYVLSIDDFNNRASFEDEIGRFSYPVDIHIAAPTKAAYEAFHKEYTTMRYKDGESYGIPYRSLVPKKLNNTYVVGRCISTDRQMQSSIRVMPGCYITGQAAGVAAAMCVEENKDTRAIDCKELQSRLVDMGGFLPNYSK